MAWSSSDDEGPSFSVSTGTWNDSMLGSFGLFPTDQRSRHVYPGVIIGRDANDQTLPNIEWHYGNSYRRGEKPTTRFLHLSLEACGKLLTNQREFGGAMWQTTGKPIGPFLWPASPVEDEDKTLSYRNPHLQAALRKVFNPILDIIIFRTSTHLGFDAFQDFWNALKGGNKAAAVSQWLADLKLPILLGDVSLVEEAAS
ncbi:hypothetical protein QCA50_007965 [Cerrena zonata]